MPQADLMDYVFKQYIHKEHITSCTKFSAINAFACNNNYNFGRDEIGKVEAESIKRGFRIGSGRQRGLGAKVVTDMWNQWFPTKQTAFFLVDIFSEGWNAYMAKGYVAQVSIRVDIAFIKDVRSDDKIDDVNYGKDYGHATCVRWRADLKKYQFIDSARGNTYYTCTEAQLKEMIKEGNMMNNAHIFIPLQLVTMITPDVPDNQRYADTVKWAIDNKLTSAGPDKKFEPNRLATRAEMVQFLRNFYNLLKAKGVVRE